MKSLEPNYVTGSSKFSYQKDRCNIGTSFHTGINIDSSDDVLFFIVGNAVDNRLGDVTPYGIFAGGDLAIVQAFARVRNGGTVHVILPLDYSKCDKDKMTIKNLVTLPPLKKMDNKWEILRKEYNKRTAHLKNEIQWVKAESIKVLKGERERPLVFFPDFYSFLLNSGDDFLTSHFPSYGKGVRQFILKASFDSQFTNLRLNAAKVYQIPKEELFITDDIAINVQELLDILSDKDIGRITNLLQLKESSDSDAFRILLKVVEDLVDGTVENRRIVIKKGKRTLYKSDIKRDRKFLRSLIALLYKLKFNEEKSFDKVEDYLLNNIAVSSTYSLLNRKAWAYRRLENYLKGISLAKAMGVADYIERIGFEKHEQKELELIAETLNHRDFFINRAYSFLNRVADEDQPGRSYIIKQFKYLFKTESARPRVNGRQRSWHRLCKRKQTPVKFLDLLDFDGLDE